MSDIWGSYRTIEGTYVKVHEMNIYFSHVTRMILHYYDQPEHDGKVFVLGSYIRYPASYFRALYPGRKIVAYQLEQLCGGPNWHSVEQTIQNLKTFDEVWEYDALNRVFLGYYGIVPARLAPTRYVPDLCVVSSRTPDIDLLFYGFVNQRRQKFLEQMQQGFYNRLRFVHAYGVFGPQLDELIARSRIVLNLHAFEPYHRQEQVRIFYPLLNARCVLSEKSQVNYFGDSILEFQGDLRPKIEEAMDRWYALGFQGATAFREATSGDAAFAEHVAAYAARAESPG